MTRSTLPLLAALAAFAAAPLAGQSSTPTPPTTPSAPPSATSVALAVPATRTVGRAALRTAIDSLLGQPQFANAFLGVLVVDAETGDTLYAQNAHKLFRPASNMKLITGAVALEKLGPSFRFRTSLVAGGPVCAGALHGDLIVSGRGDPTVSDDFAHDALIPLRAMADSLRAAGVHRIVGKLVPGADVFPGLRIGDGWEWDDLQYYYGAGVDELFLNEGVARLIVRGGARVGAPAPARITPAIGYPALKSLARTGDTTGLTVVVDSSTGAAMVTGTVARAHIDTSYIVYRDQPTAYLRALRTALAQRGITVADQAHAGTCAPSARRRAVGDTLVRWASAPLPEVLHRLEKPSQNQIAEILLRTIGLEVTGVGTADSGRAVVSRTLVSWGADSTGFDIQDGSGLSRDALLSPATVVRVLSHMRQDTAFAAYYDALPIAGVDGTLDDRMIGTAAQGRVRAKTGSFMHVRSLSGYAPTANGRVVLFSVLANNWTTPSREVTHTQDAIADLLARLDLASP